MVEEFYSVEQVAGRLSLHPKTVLRYIKEGRLRGTRIGKAYRITRSDLDSFVGVNAETTGTSSRVTSIVEIADISLAASERIANLLNAAAMGGNESTMVQISTAFNPSVNSMKVVIIGSPRDAARLLQFIDLQLEQSR
jgi:excisionase family DNA binding protein